MTVQIAMALFQPLPALHVNNGCQRLFQETLLNICLYRQGGKKKYRHKFKYLFLTCLEKTA